MEQSELKLLETDLLHVKRIQCSYELQNILLSIQRIHFGGNIYEVGDRANVHTHNEIQLHFIISGEFIFKTKTGTQYRFQQGCAALIVPDVFHGWVCSQRGVMLGCEISIYGEDANYFKEFLKTELREGIAFFCSGEYYDAFKNLVSMTLFSKGWQSEISTGLFSSFVMSLFSHLVDVSSWTITKNILSISSLKRKDRINVAIQYIEDNYMRSVGAKDVALHVGVTAVHLNRLFQHYYNTSASKYILNKRLEKAYDLLKNNAQMSIKEVCFSTGFLSQSHFSRSFKAKFALSPTEIIR